MHQNELNSELERLYVHFWEGTITDLEMSRLQDLLAASPERRAEFKELQALALLVERRADADKFDVRSALLKVKGKLRRRRVEIFRRWVYAAGVAILIGIGSVLLWIGKPEEKSLPLPVSQTLLAEKGGGMGKVFLEVGEDRQIELQPDTLKSVIHLYADVAEEEKLSELKSLGIRLSDEIKKGVGSMCNLSELVEKRGIDKGIEQGENRFKELTGLLLKENKLSELKRATEDREYLHRLYNKYNLL